MKSLKLLALTILLGWCLAPSAGAQSLDMDMSWALQGQQQAWDMSQLQAWQAAQTWYNQVQAYRQATGYTGFIASPVTPQALQQSVRGAIDSWDGFIQVNGACSNRMDATQDVFADQAVMNQAPYVNPYTGETFYPNGDYPTYYVTPDGRIQGTNLYQPPDPYWQWTPLAPGW